MVFKFQIFLILDTRVRQLNNQKNYMVNDIFGRTHLDNCGNCMLNSFSVDKEPLISSVIQ
jgi:hypothetical protein